MLHTHTIKTNHPTKNGMMSATNLWGRGWTTSGSKTTLGRLRRSDGKLVVEPGWAARKTIVQPLCYRLQPGIFLFNNLQLSSFQIPVQTDNLMVKNFELIHHLGITI